MSREHPNKYLIDAARTVGREVFALPARATYTDPLDRGKLRIYHMPSLERVAERCIPWRIQVKSMRGEPKALMEVRVTLPDMDVLPQLEGRAVQLQVGDVAYTGRINREFRNEQLAMFCDYDGGAPMFVVWDVPRDEEHVDHMRELPVPATAVKDMIIAF